MNAMSFEVPDYIEPLQAWRIWHVIDKHGATALRSVIKPMLWPPGEPLAAECLRTRLFPRWRRRPAHPSPDATCACGIYATSLERLDQYVNEALPADVLACVVGQVSLWGTVLECERAYRASRAYPSELYVPLDDRTPRRPVDRQALIDGLSISYGVPTFAVDGHARETPELLRRELISH